MIKNISSQTMSIRLSNLSNLSNFLLGGLVAGCLVIGIAHLVERGKRTAIEEQFFTEVKELPAHEVEEIIKNAILKIISESKKVKNELLSDQKVAGVSNPEYGVESCVASMELTAGGLSVDKESVLGKLITLSPKDYVAILFSSSKVMAFATIYSNSFRSDLKKPFEFKKVEEEKWVEGVRYPPYSFISSTDCIRWFINLLPISRQKQNYAAGLVIQMLCPQCEVLIAEMEALAKDIFHNKVHG
jgi:hypothetical protein